MMIVVEGLTVSYTSLAWLTWNSAEISGNWCTGCFGLPRSGPGPRGADFDHTMADAKAPEHKNPRISPGVLVFNWR